jgi:DNA primase
MSNSNEIKARLDIVNYIQQYTPLKKTGRVYKACCPFHGEKTPSFVVNPDKQSWRCFGACAEGGDVFNFAMKQHGWSFGEAVRELGRQVGIVTERQTPEQQQREVHQDKLRGILKTLAAEYHTYLLTGDDPDAQAALTYARTKRGFTDETLKRFQIGYAPKGWDNAVKVLTGLGYSEADCVEAGVLSQNEQGRVYDRFRHRLMIPIRDERGRVVGFGARALDADDNPKYLNSPQSPLFDKSRLLFGFDMAKKHIRDSATAVLVEGYMDAIQAHQAGYANVVAQMGTAMTEMQLNALVKNKSPESGSSFKIVLALDTDAAGQNATKRSLEVARETLQADHGGRLGVDMRILQVPNGKDPDDYLREQPQGWAALVAAAAPVADFLIDVETHHLPPPAQMSKHPIEEREALARRLLPMLTATRNSLYSTNNISRLAARLFLREADLLAWAEQLALQARPKPASEPRSAQERSLQREAEEALPRRAVPKLPPDFDPYDGPIYDEESMANAAPDAGGWQPTVAQAVDIPVQRAAARPPAVPAAPLEVYCLKVLIDQPPLLYNINGRLHELARKHPMLRDTLGELAIDDFTRSNHRLLFTILVRALNQDEHEPQTYFQTELGRDELLARECEIMCVDEFHALTPLLRFGLAVDLEHLPRDPASSTKEIVIEQVLRLRLERLMHEVEDIRYLMLEDAQAHAEYRQRIPAYLLAKSTLETELSRLRKRG